MNNGNNNKCIHEYECLKKDDIEARAKSLVERFSQGLTSGLTARIIQGESAVGGGSGPNTHPPTVLIALEHNTLSPDRIESRLRTCIPPVIARIAEGKVLLDLRTVALEEETELVHSLLLVARNSS